MSENQKPTAVLNKALEEISESKNGGDPKNLSLDALVLLLNTTRLNQLQTESQKELTELKKRQEQVSFLHNLIKSINKITSSSGELDISSNTDLQALLSQAKDMGVDLDHTKHQYNKEERDRLIENVRMSVEDYNVQNEMQLQTVNRLTNERYESYQMARSILKPLHESKIQTARDIKGR
jgi:hypothetical protein